MPIKNDWRVRRLLFVTCLLAGAATTVGGARSQLDDNTLYQVLPRDAIPAIDNPRFVSVAESDADFDAHELVIGLVGQTEQRAYSTRQLDKHEIVNDQFEGMSIAVTWCPLCGTGIVYNRTIGERTLTFGVSGLLFRDGLVMFDRETDTLWTHVDGQAVQGTLRGEVLTPLPAIHATWEEWKRLYPQSRVLKKSGKMRSPYEAYARNKRELGIFGRRNVDTRLPGKERILGVRTQDSAVAFPVAAVRAARIVQEMVDALAVLLVAAPGGFPVVAYDWSVGGRLLTFELLEADAPIMRDHETQTEWDVASGYGLQGPLKGERLTRLAAHPAFWFGWRGYFPDSATWTPEGIRWRP